MTPPTDTSTFTPIIVGRFDLGIIVPAWWVGLFFSSANNLWHALDAPGVADSPTEGRQLQVLSARLESPLGVVFGVAMESARPIAWVTMSWFLFERAFRLLMEWQTHRVEMQKDPRQLDRLDAGFLSRKVMAEHYGPEARFYENSGDISASLMNLASVAVILEVRRED